MQHVIVHGGNRQHNHKTEDGKDALSGDVVETIAVVMLKSVYVAGGIQGGQTDDEDDHQQHEKVHIEARREIKKRAIQSFAAIALRCGRLFRRTPSSHDIRSFLTK